MSKLILSLWNADDFPFSVAGCLSNLDANLTQLSLEMIEDYARQGETSELIEVDYKAYEVSPGLVELSSAAKDAMYAVRNKWERERKAERERLYGDD